MKQLFLAAALLLGASQAHAVTILASIQEDIGSVFQATLTVTTTSTKIDSAYARLGLSASGSTIVPMPNRVESNTFSAASSDFWFAAQLWHSVNNTLNDIGVAFFDGADVRLMLRGTGTSQQIKASKRDTTPTTTDLVTATGSLCNQTLCRLDCHVVYAVSGSIDCYNNGTPILSYTGDITTNGATSLNKVALGAFNSSAGAAVWSEVFVSDTDTRSMRSMTCAPSTAGATQSWTGSAGNINANSYDDSTFNYTTTNNALSQWTGGCAIPTVATIVDVRSYGRLAIGGTGPQNARFSLHVGGSDQDNGSDLSGLTTSFANYKYDWGANSPTSGTAWTRSDLASGFSFGVKSLP